MKLTACIINYNNSSIFDTLKSVYTLCEEIVVVDCSKNTAIKKIASNFTNKVYILEPSNDNSFIINFALSKVTGDYVLLLFGGEFLEYKSLLHLKEFISSNSSISGLYLKEYRNYLEHQHSTHLSLRVFKNYSKIKFTGKISPIVARSIISNVKHPIFDVLNIQIMGMNKIFLKSELENRLNRELFILYLYDDQAKDWFYNQSFGNLMISIGEYEEAINLYTLALACEEQPFQIYLDAPTLLFNLMYCYIQLKRYDDGLYIYSTYCENYMDFKGFSYLAFICSLYVNKACLSKRLYNRYLNITSSQLIYPSYDIDTMFMLERKLYEQNIKKKLYKLNDIKKSKKLIVGVYCTDCEFLNFSLLYKLKLLNCTTYLISDKKLNNIKEIKGNYNIVEIFFENTLYNNNKISVNILNNFISKVSFSLNKYHINWILMINSNESIVISELNEIIDFINNTVAYKGAYLNFKREKSHNYDELRLFQFSEKLFYETNNLNSIEYSFKGDYGYNKTIKLFKNNIP